MCPSEYGALALFNMSIVVCSLRTELNVDLTRAHVLAANHPETLFGLHLCSLHLTPSCSPLRQEEEFATLSVDMEDQESQHNVTVLPGSSDAHEISFGDLSVSVVDVLMMGVA